MSLTHLLMFAAFAFHFPSKCSCLKQPVTALLSKTVQAFETSTLSVFYLFCKLM